MAARPGPVTDDVLDVIQLLEPVCPFVAVQVATVSLRHGYSAAYARLRVTAVLPVTMLRLRVRLPVTVASP
jgi:hypothetical protein